MAITCTWTDVVGKVEGDGYSYTMYGGGNVFCCICYDDESGHTLVDFIVDEKHLRNVLSDPENHWGRYSNIELNGRYPQSWKIAKELNKAGYTVKIYRGEK